MLEVSLFADESGECGTESKYYILTLLFHDQSRDISKPMMMYRQALHDKSLPDIPMHASPLMNGHDEYAYLNIQDRKRLFSAFFVMLQHLPVSYTTFSYVKAEFATTDALMTRMRRDIVNFMFEHLEWLQAFDKIKIYYDDGQSVVTNALHSAVEYALSTDAVLYKDSSSQDYRLAQATDLLCTLELAAIKYASKEQTKTDERFFGGFSAFKKNYLKKIRRKRLS